MSWFYRISRRYNHSSTQFHTKERERENVEEFRTTYWERLFVNIVRKLDNNKSWRLLFLHILNTWSGGVWKEKRIQKNPYSCCAVCLHKLRSVRNESEMSRVLSQAESKLDFIWSESNWFIFFCFIPIWHLK